MRKLILVSMAFLIVLTAVMLAPNVYACGGGNPSVATYDVITGALKEIFNIGEDVNITAYSEYTPYEVIVIDSEGVTRFTDTSTTPRYSKIVSGITDKLGWWEVKAGTETTHYGTAWYQVIPEAPLGAIMILTACFAGLGVTQLRRKKKLF